MTSQTTAPQQAAVSLTPQAAATGGAPPAKQAPTGWTREEFDILAVRTANEPQRVLAAMELFKARLINFAMLKDMLDIRP